MLLLVLWQDVRERDNALSGLELHHLIQEQKRLPVRQDLFDFLPA
jgi:hypothetical protein